MANSSPATDASSTAFDPNAQQVATVYANGFIAAAEAAGQTEALLEELTSLVHDVLERMPGLESLLSSGLISHEEKVGVIDRTLGQQASPMLLNFLKVLSAHGRLGVIRAINHAAKIQLDKLRGRVHVDLRTAAPLDEAQARAISDRLRALVGADPVLDRKVDPELIGGLVLRIGDTVFDGSVSAQLEQIRTQMIHRSVHEIQSRRDRFSHSAGN